MGENAISAAASAMGKRSAAVRRKKLGDAEFLAKMQEYGKKGGRPRKKQQTDESDKGAK
jgi:hypothetical protein